MNADFVAFVQSANEQKTATLDLDAVLIETAKSSALYCYKHFQAYQPYNAYWIEQGLTLHSEFRDGNVPASYDELRVLKEGLSHLLRFRLCPANKFTATKTRSPPTRTAYIRCRGFNRLLYQAYLNIGMQLGM